MTIEQAAIRYYNARQATAEARALFQVACNTPPGACERGAAEPSVFTLRCFEADRLPPEEWCGYCRQRQPHWIAWHKAIAAQRGALKSLMALCAKAGAS